MNLILKQLQELAETDLYVLFEAVEQELHRRDEVVGEVPDSARRRVIERDQSYRRRNGAAAMPVRVVGLGKPSGRRHAA